MNGISMAKGSQFGLAVEEALEIAKIYQKQYPGKFSGIGLCSIPERKAFKKRLQDI